MSAFTPKATARADVRAVSALGILALIGWRRKRNVAA
jgi:hypothetical protein